MDTFIKNLNTIETVTSIGSMTALGITAITSLCLFIFWYKKKALLNFQSWALLTFIINFILAIHFSPLKILINHDLSIYIVRILMFLQFSTTIFTLFNLWRISEKFVPKNLVKIKIIPKKRNLLARTIALYYAFKTGGNDKKSTKKIRKAIKKSLLLI